MDSKTLKRILNPEQRTVSTTRLPTLLPTSTQGCSMNCVKKSRTRSTHLHQHTHLLVACSGTLVASAAAAAAAAGAAAAADIVAASLLHWWCMRCIAIVRCRMATHKSML